MSHQVLTQEQQATTLANEFPEGDPFRAVHLPTTVARSWLRGLAEELIRMDDLIFRSLDGLIPALDNNDDFIGVWEEAVGIPDTCFSADPSGIPINTRWLHVIVKLAAMNIQTQSDFVALAARFETAVTVTPGFDYWTANGNFNTNPVGTVIDTAVKARFVIVIEFSVVDPLAFPFTFPIEFVGAESTILQCLYTKLKPANCDLHFTFV